MKILFKTILSIAFATTLFVSGAFVVNAAISAGGGQFDPDPAVSDGGNNYTGFLSIKNGNPCSNCANNTNSISVNIPNSGDTALFTLYLSFRNKGNDTIQDVEALMDVDNGSVMSGTLSGSGASTITDTASINNLPNSYDIDFVSAYVENTHGTTDPDQCAGYNYYANASQNQVLNSGVPLGDLDTQFGGWCDQGYVIATFEVENTNPQTPTLNVNTQSATNIGTTTARLNGQLTSGNNVDVWFRYSTNQNVSCSNGLYANGPDGINAVQNFNANISGLSPETTYHYVACGEDANNNFDNGNPVSFTTDQLQTSPLNINTQSATNVETNSAQLNGQLTSGDNVDVWFRYSTNSNVSCFSGSHVNGPNNISGLQNFNADISNLSSGTVYHYLACGEDVNGNLDQGDVITFITLDSGTETLVIDTEPANPIYQTTAKLNGRVLAGETDFVFFVLGTSSSVSCFTGVPRYPDDWGIPREAGDPFELMLPNNDLSSDTTYYYRACAKNAFNQTVTGDLEMFTTDDDGSGNNEPDAYTQSPQDVDEDSAELRGSIDMNDFQNGVVFFVYGQDESRIEDTANDYDSYNEANNDEDNDEFEVVLVDTDLDGNEDYEESVSGLDTDERYYYQICVEFENSNGDDELICGGVEDFRTDNDDSDDLEIETIFPRSVTQTTAEICGDLVDDGGESRQTWLDFRPSNQNSYNETPRRQRSEGVYCERVSGLTPNTSYTYRACADGECAATRTFRTAGIGSLQGLEPLAITSQATNIRSNYALLQGMYVANADRGTVWFNYGRTQGLGRQTIRQNVSGNYGTFNHNFTNLAPNTTYYYQAAIQTISGFDTGAIYSFRTNGGGGIISQPPVVVVDDDDDFDLSSLGLGLSLVRLDIDNDQEVVTEGERVDYVIEWQNISELDLDNLELKVTLPPELEVTDISRGRFDVERNVVFYTIDSLEGADFENDIPGEGGELVVTGIMGDIRVGNLITAEAQLSYDNPVNDAKEDAIDFDIDEAGVQIAGLTASVFGLANITFLGWLVILLGLFIIFLVARWLYLEREEMRAQAYVTGGYGPYTPIGSPRYDNYPPHQNYNDQPRYDIPPADSQAPASRDDYYEPYRPNRG